MRLRLWGTVTVVGAVVVALSSLGAGPAGASSSCPQANALNKVKAYVGTASNSYVSGTVVGPSPQDYDTWSIDRTASDLQIDVPNGEPGEAADFDSESTPTGGTIMINDTYSSTEPVGTSHQTADGPAQAGQGEVQIEFDEDACTYQLFVDAGITTTTAVTGDDAPDTPSEGLDSVTPTEPIPSNLVLSGQASIPPTASGGEPSTGYYDLSGDPDWGEGVSTDSGSTDPAPGTASVTWDLKPSGGSSTSGCVVPAVKGESLAAATTALSSAGCKRGVVTHKHSRAVAKGDVISSNPKAGTKHASGAKVTLVVSAGK